MDKLQELADAYPDVITETMLSRWYVPEGWIKLLPPYLDVLRATGAKLLHVKEKFGGIRVTSSRSNEVGLWHWIAIAKAEAMLESAAWMTCEACGGVASTQTDDDRWVRTMCEGCRDKRRTAL